MHAQENIDYLVNIKDYYFLVGMKEKEFDRIFKKSFRIEWLKREVQESTRWFG